MYNSTYCIICIIISHSNAATVERNGEKDETFFKSRESREIWVTWTCPFVHKLLGDTGVVITLTLYGILMNVNSLIVSD